jgi:hypothetical protein
MKTARRLPASSAGARARLAGECFLKKLVMPKKHRVIAD